ncbi:HD domain-containing phosphohydrolase [Desulfurobacterium sp.]|uniref:HD-GYP domain-containing protein n=1 Tax=Desulfurobacterium sp. TaxID=2004706 RepID=UPI002625AA84|nr:HD domain-containing phosphohydrolase [Desulfurobacterium sp.]
MKTMTIVLIDDQPFFLLFMEEMIKKIDFPIPIETKSFRNAEDALDFIEENNVDMIISDYVMPEMNGIELLQEVRQLPDKESVIFIMVTAEHARNIKRKALALGATDFLTKPLDKLEFIPKVRNLLRLRLKECLLKNKAQLLKYEIDRSLKEIKMRDREIILRLSMAAEFRDEMTGHHIERVALYSQLIAKNLGYSDAFCEDIYLAAPLHDIGKIAIPDCILKKKGKLTPEEMEIMKKHTIYGYRLLANSKVKVLEMAARIALYHHENWDGSGYPYGLKGKAIPVEARIVSVADVFDALGEARPYKKGWNIQSVFKFIKENAGKKFDPQIVKVFLSVKDEILKIKERLTPDGKASHSLFNDYIDFKPPPIAT